MDLPNDSLVTTSYKLPGAMSYPSTTQALFALIVMIIVLFFILVYCCWGTFSCANQENSTTEGAGVQARSGIQPMRHILPGSHAVIVPINNMLYVGDPESQCIYEIPLEQDKPPAYTEVPSEGPPPPYVLGTPPQTQVSTDSPQSNQELREESQLPEFPPPYEEFLSNKTSTQSINGEESLSTQSGNGEEPLSIQSGIEEPLSIHYVNEESLSTLPGNSEEPLSIQSGNEEPLSIQIGNGEESLATQSGNEEPLSIQNGNGEESLATQSVNEECLATQSGDGEKCLSTQSGNNEKCHTSERGERAPK